MFKTEKKHKIFFKLPLVIILVFSFLSFGNVAEAFYEDIDLSQGNLFSATSLDFTLTPDAEWDSLATSLDMFPEDSITRNAVVTKVGLLDFEYDAQYSFVAGNVEFCNVLDLTAYEEGDLIFDGKLVDFLYEDYLIDVDGVDSWDFTISVPTDATDLGVMSCEFDFVFDANQQGFQYDDGYSDTELFNNVLGSGEWEVTVTSSLAPIIDALVSEEQSTSNYGSDTQLGVEAQTDMTKRSFIKFNLPLPVGTTINLATLNVFNFNGGPVSTNRNYEARRVSDDWSENAITWQNQPSVSGGATDNINVLLETPAFMSLDVSSDVAGFISGAYANYGWRISDSSEGTASSTYSNMVSRENSEVNKRPYMEIDFIVPEVTTDHLVINEVYYHVDTLNKGTDSDNEWVEIYNPTNSAVDVSGWEICDSNACDVLPATTSIPARGFAVISKDASTWNTYWTDILTLGATTIELGSPIGNRLANSGDSVILKNNLGVVIDTVSYGSDNTQLNPAVPNSGIGNSVARVIRGYDTDTAGDWIINASANPGTNPGGSSREIMRFTTEGVLVASFEQGLEPVVLDNSVPNSSDLILHISDEITPLEKIAIPDDLLPIKEAPLDETAIPEESPLVKQVSLVDVKKEELEIVTPETVVEILSEIVEIDEIITEDVDVQPEEIIEEIVILEIVDDVVELPEITKEMILDTVSESEEEILPEEVVISETLLIVEDLEGLVLEEVSISEDLPLILMEQASLEIIEEDIISDDINQQV